jgi:hypothetical protein
MSGGSFDYACYKVLQFSDELKNKLEAQGKDLQHDGYPQPKWESHVSDKLYEIAQLSEYVGLLMKEAEWLYSGDTGEDTFISRMHKIEENQNMGRNNQ